MVVARRYERRGECVGLPASALLGRCGDASYFVHVIGLTVTLWTYSSYPFTEGNGHCTWYHPSGIRHAAPGCCTCLSRSGRTRSHGPQLEREAPAWRAPAMGVAEAAQSSVPHQTLCGALPPQRERCSRCRPHCDHCAAVARGQPHSGAPPCAPCPQGPNLARSSRPRCTCCRHRRKGSPAACRLRSSPRQLLLRRRSRLPPADWPSRCFYAGVC
mmetsp:Transcript_1148/g.4020  ORF Transcript_1148/g.4020 Transcript_1148/m.4020 type:complete len:215 (-) Transcript_1148:332-976(-)